jgi:hypothetical protein
MIIWTGDHHWVLQGMNGSVQIMRRSDFATCRFERGEESAHFGMRLEALIRDFSSRQIDEVLSREYNFAPIDPHGFLPLEVFFRYGGEKLTAESGVNEIRALPKSNGRFGLDIQLPRGFAEITDFENIEECRAAGLVLAERLGCDLVDFATRYHSAWVEKVADGHTALAFAEWLRSEIGDPLEAVPDDLIYEGWTVWGDRVPYWAPQGVPDPVQDLAVYPTQGQAMKDNEQELLDDEDGAAVTRVAIRRDGTILCVDPASKRVFEELSRERYYNEFGMELPASRTAPAEDGPEP